MSLLILLMQAIAEAYPKDPSAPSVTLSIIPSGALYASVCRYTAKFGADKRVVTSAIGVDMQSALEACATQWLRLSHADGALLTGSCVEGLRAQFAPSRFRLLEVD